MVPQHELTVTIDELNGLGPRQIQWVLMKCWHPQPVQSSALTSHSCAREVHRGLSAGNFARAARTTVRLMAHVPGA